MGARDDYGDEEEFEEEEEYEEGEEAEGDEGEEEAEERSAKRKRGSTFIDDTAEEDEDEEEEEDAPRKKGKSAYRRSAFIDDVAAVASDDEEEEEGEEDDFIDHGTELPEETRPPPRMRRPPSILEDDFEDVEDFVRKKYSGRSEVEAYDEAEATEVEQQSLLPSVKDPKLWMVKCQIGHEREAVVSLMQKYINLEQTNNPLLIKSAVALDNLKGYVYVESDKEAYVKEACKGMRLLYAWQVKLVPIKEMSGVLTVEKKSVDLEPGAWVRVKLGAYKGDLAQVVEVDTIRQKATVKLIPRIDLEALAAKQEGRTDYKKKATRPPARFISTDEFKDLGLKVQERRDPYTGEMTQYVNDLKLKDGYLWRIVSLKTLDSNNIIPTLDELQRFQRPPEGEEAGSEAAGLSLGLAGSTKQRVKLMKGDVVSVVDGDLKGLMGLVEKVDGDEAIIRPKHKDLSEPLPVSVKHLRKFFKTGDHVKVIAGQHDGATGMIVKIEDHIAVILSDAAKEHIKVFTRDVVSSTEVTSGPSQLGEYELHDLVALDQTTVGMIVRVDQAGCQILKGIPDRSVIMPAKLRDIRRKLFDRKATTQDADGSVIGIKDPVRIVSGYYKDKQAVVEHIHRTLVFVYDRHHLENGGYFCVHARACRGLGGIKKAVEDLSLNGNRFSQKNKFDSMKSPMNVLASPRQSLQSPYRTGNTVAGRGGRGGVGFGGRGGSRRDESMIGRIVKVRQGPFKGYKGRILDCTDTNVRIELESQMKVITVRRDQLPEASGNSEPQPTPFRESPRYGAGSETPMHPSRTPMHPSFGRYGDGSATPTHEGMRTPMRDRAWNPKITATPHRDDSSDNPWMSSSTPYGFSSQINTPDSMFDTPTPSSSWGAQLTPSDFSQTSKSTDSFWGTPSAMGGLPSSLNPHTPGSLPATPVPLPMTPGIPMTPGMHHPSTPGIPATPGIPSTPGLGVIKDTSWCVPDLIVTYPTGGNTATGVIREVLSNGMCRVARGMNGEGEIATVSANSLEVVHPSSRIGRVLVLDGDPLVGSIGKLIGFDVSDGLVKFPSGEVKIIKVSDLGELCDS